MNNCVKNSLRILKTTGFQSYECRFLETTSDEVNISNGRMDLLCSRAPVSLSLTGILNGSKASTTITKCDESSVAEAAEQLLRLAETSPPDDANEIAPLQEAPFREKGPVEADVTGMIQRLQELENYCSEKYPTITLRRATLEFTSTLQTYGNSNGSLLSDRQGIYKLSLTIIAAEGGKCSSFNYTTVMFNTLEKPLKHQGSIDLLLKQATGQIHPKNIQGNFTGDVIITPECMNYFLYLLTMQLQDSYLIKGTSLYQDSLGRQIAEGKFTLRTKPVSEELPNSSFITQDGFPAVNLTPIENGVLKSYLLSLYGSNKSGYPRSGNQGGYCIIEPGEKTLEEMIASIDKGLLLTRFSGGMPSESGDFSGVAKNSYYIEKGRITHPVKEVMISINLREMFMNIRDLSRERVNMGSILSPWIQFADISIHGK